MAQIYPLSNEEFKHRLSGSPNWYAFRHSIRLQLILSSGRLSPTTGSSIPTVTDNLSGDGVITANEIGVSLEPTPQANVMNGELAWGLARSCMYVSRTYRHF
jgi:hypothetical protein